MRFRKKRNPSKFAECNSSKSGIVVDEKDVNSSVDGKDLDTVTRCLRDHSLTLRTRSSGSMNGVSIASKRPVIVEFSIAIEAVDGIIATGTGRRPNPGQYNVPTFAVISYRQKVSGSQKIVKSNIPSMPLQKSASSIGNRERYHASFGYREGPRIEPEVIEMALPMTVDNRSLSGYETKQIDFSLGLMKGSEVLNMGVACVSLNGDELEDSKLVRLGEEKTVKTTSIRGKKKVTTSTTTAVGARCMSFSQDPSRKYSLQRATLRVTVKSRVQVPKNSSTNKYMRVREPSTPPPISELISIGHSGSISVITGEDSLELMTKQVYSSSQRSNIKKADSLLKTVSTMSLSKSASTAVGTIDEESYESESASDDESVQTKEECIGFVPFEADSSSVNEESTLFSSSNDSDEENTCDGSNTFDGSTVLDDVSLGTIHFKEMGVGGTLMPSHRDLEVYRRRSRSRKNLGVVQKEIKRFEKMGIRSGKFDHDEASQFEL